MEITSSNGRRAFNLPRPLKHPPICYCNCWSDERDRRSVPHERFIHPFAGGKRTEKPWWSKINRKRTACTEQAQRSSTPFRNSETAGSTETYGTAAHGNGNSNIRTARKKINKCRREDWCRLLCIMWWHRHGFVHQDGAATVLPEYETNL